MYIYHDYYENPCALGGNYTSHFTNKLLTFAAARTERRRHLSPQHRLRHNFPELRVPQEPPRAEAARDPQSVFVAEGEGQPSQMGPRAVQAHARRRAFYRSARRRQQIRGLP